MATQDSSLDVLPRSKQWRPSWRRPGLAHKTILRGTLSQDPVQMSNEASNAAHRIRHLEKNVLFLREQHTETLQQLHKEIERLKTENRELTFKLVMCRCCTGESGSPAAAPDTVELHSLRANLAQERARIRQLKTLIERKVLEHQKSVEVPPCESQCRAVSRVHSTLLTGSQPLSLVEIKHIQLTNTQQKHELEQIKADLRDVLYSHKWTPDAFLLARAYVNQDEGRSDALPQLAPDNSMFDRAYRRVREEVTLPALTPHIKSFPERQKRSQALRNKLHVARSLQ